jgi:CRP-like cAMP-binding protein
MWRGRCGGTVQEVLGDEQSVRDLEPVRLGVRASRLSLFDIDADFAGGLDGGEFEVARRALLVRTAAVARGEWDPPRTASASALGILIVDGILVRELSLGESIRYAELLGPGDLIRPWQQDDAGGLLPWRCSWRAAESCTIAELGPEIARAAARWPEVTAALTSRAIDRSRRQAIAAAIPSLVRIRDRVVVLFAHLAERWGHVTCEGIILRAPLTHQLIASLTATRRPSVTTALSALNEQGLVTRRDEHEWMIDHGIREEIGRVCLRRLLDDDASRVYATA